MTTFKINQIVFDEYAKDYVRISNGISHKDDGSDFVPTEAIALRVVAFDNGKPVVAYTYRKVDPKHLRETVVSTEPFANLPEKLNKHYIGRI